MEKVMQATGSWKYDLTVRDLLIVVSTIGGLHYLFSLFTNYNNAWSISGVTGSADVGITAAFGVIAYSLYRMLTTRPS